MTNADLQNLVNDLKADPETKVIVLTKKTGEYLEQPEHAEV